MPDGTFSPSKVLSRAEAATIMAKILGLEVKEGRNQLLQTLKIIGQLLILLLWKRQESLKEGNGKFNPNGQMTRAAMATMLVQAYQLEKKVHEELSTLFPDVKDHWGEKFINILVSMGISSGVDGGRWQPDRSITRAEAAQLVAVTDKSKDNELKMKKISISKNSLRIMDHLYHLEFQRNMALGK